MLKVGTSATMTQNELDTHTELAARRCELILTVSSDSLTAMQTNAGELGRPLKEEGSVGVGEGEGDLPACVCREYSHGPEENQQARQ